MDKHNTARICQVVSVLVSLFFVVIGFAGYQRTGDIMLVLLFAGLAIIAYFLVKLLFLGVDRLLDSLDDKRS